MSFLSSAVANCANRSIDGMKTLRFYTWHLFHTPGPLLRSQGSLCAWLHISTCYIL